jgi:ATP-dependent Clp protease adapter protein ClpS
MVRSLVLVLSTFLWLVVGNAAFTVPSKRMASAGARAPLVLPKSATVAERSAAFVMNADSGAAPTVLDRPAETIEKVEEDVKEKQKHGTEAWEIRLYNDPMNKREFVARCLTEITGMSDNSAYTVMMQAHQNGLSTVGRYAFEMAELYYSSLRGEGLSVDMIQVDDE